MATSTFTRTVVILAALALAAPCLAAGAEVDAIPYFHRVNERVAVSGQPTPEQIAALPEAGFRTIINLRPDAELPTAPERQAAEAAGLRYVAIPFETASPSGEAAEEFLRATDDPAIYPVLIHCATANRASALWLVRRVLRDGWSLADAEKEARASGLTNEKLLEFARAFIEAHPADGKGRAAPAGP